MEQAYTGNPQTPGCTYITAATLISVTRLRPVKNNVTKSVSTIVNMESVYR